MAGEDAGQELSALRARLIGLQRRRAREFPRQLRPDDWRRHDLDAEIRDVQARIRALDPKTRADPDLANPHAAGEDLAIFVDAAEKTNDPRYQAARERRRAAEAREKAEKEERRRAELEAMGPAERAVVESSKGEVDPAAVEAARARDEVTSRTADLATRRGCVVPSRTLVGIGIGAAVVIAVIVVLLGSGDGDEAARVATGSGGNSATGGDGGGGGDASAYAGHYVLSRGLDSPDGLDLHNYGDRGEATTDSAAATIDIAASGQVTGGRYHVAGDVGGCHYTFDATGATGNVTPSGSGSVVFTGTQQQSGPSCASDSDRVGRMFNFGITTNGLFLCRTPMATLETCQGSAVRAHFRKA